MKILKKYAALLFLALLATTATFAQPEPEKEPTPTEKRSFLKRFVVGGNVGVGYTNGWNLNLSPTVGYRVTDGFVAGVGVSYIYSDFRNPWDGFRWTQNVLGGRVFLQQLLFRGIYAHAEYEYLRFSTRLRDEQGNDYGTVSRRAPGVLLGGGYNSNFGNGLGFGIEALYNILYRADTSPYPSPFILRGGVTYGF